jgi:hypothetical protein
MQNNIKPYKNTSLSDIDGELWMDIIGYEGLYSISNFGRVKSLPKKHGRDINNRDAKIKKSYPTYKGYIKVQLRKNDIHKNFFVHRLVLIHFKEHSDLEVNHKDLDRTNNHIDNLEYVTGKENVNHAMRLTNRTWDCIKGANNKFSRKVVALNPITNELIHSFICMRDVSDILDETKHLNKDWVRKRVSDSVRHNKEYLGYKWMYKEDYETKFNILK